jgi:hypothetical protein
VNPSTPPPDAIRQLAAAIEQAQASVRVSCGAEATNTRAVTMQVVDRRGRAWAKRWLVLFYIANGPASAPGTSQTVTLTTGTVIKALTTDSVYLVRTDENGVAVINLTVSGAASRYVIANVLPEASTSPEIPFAA